MLKVSSFVINRENSKIPGIIIFGESYNEAIRVAEMTRDHYEIPGSKSQINLFFEDDGLNTVRMLLNFDSSIGNIEIDKIEKEVLNNIIECLERVDKYIIMIGYDFNKMTIIDSKIFSLFKSDLIYNKDIIYGKSIDHVDWVNLFN